MLIVFQVLFFTGVLYTVISFLLGHLLDFADVGGDVDGDLDLDGDIHGVAVSPLKPVTIAAFITVFGGVGLILINGGYSSLIAAVIALAAGLMVAYLMFRFIIMPLHRAQNTSAVSQAELIGSLAYAALSMKENKFGRIKYTVEGNTYSAPAKSVDGRIIERGVPVVIIDIKKNTFYVKEVKGGSM